ncbi:prepilin-type N-terminal cleavage/methylation domain-containing protein [Dehalococcoidia bacterium]|nr:prepilin-type N-terminal cleavage/methylation domain-containing protein [Dehalococcoidia bacterium]
MKKFIKGQRGFTLIEIIIVLAILAILAALLGPQLAGFLARGDRASYDADKRTLELSVMAYYTADPVVREWPIWGPDVGAPYDHDNDGNLFDHPSARNGLIDIDRLVAAGLLADDAAVRSADGHSHRHRHATSEGSYIWYVADEDGTIKSMFWDAEDKDGDGVTTEWLGDGFWGVYP